MFIPAAIGTLAALLSILEVMIKLATYLSPQMKRALREAREKIKVLSPSSSIEDGISIVNESILKNIPASEVSGAQKDLSLGLEALDQYISGVNTADSIELPKYGQALALLINFLGKYFNQWHCFEVRGKTYAEYQSPVASTFYLLPMPKSEKAIRTCKLIENVVPQSDPSNSWYFCAKQNYGHPIVPKGLMNTNGVYMQPKGESQVPNLQHFDLHFRDYGFSIVSDMLHINKNYMLTVDVAERLVVGLLEDLIDYHRIVNGEVQRSRNLKSRMSGLLKR